MVCDYRKKGDCKCPICGESMTYDKNKKCYACKQHYNIVVLHPNFFKFVKSNLELIKVKKIKEIDCNTLELARD